MGLWGQWLAPVQPKVSYTKFRHLEFKEQSNARAQVQELLARLIYSYHTHPHGNLDLIASLGYPLVAQAMTGDQRPNPANLDTCKAHFAEILACEFAGICGYEVPVLRLRYNPNPDQSEKGDDLLGFRFTASPTDPDYLIVGEAKYRSTYSAITVQKAYEALQNVHRPYPTSMEFLAAILDLQGEKAKADRVRQIQARLRASSDQVHKESLLFICTEGTPRDPFRVLEDREVVLPNLVAINISFQKGISDWISELFSQDILL